MRNAVWDCNSGTAFSKFGLELHPEKTALIEFGRMRPPNVKQARSGKTETLNFLGFTHIVPTRRGRFTIKRKSMPKKMRAKLQEDQNATAALLPWT